MPRQTPDRTSLARKIRKSETNTTVFPTVGYFFYSLYDDCIYDEPYRQRRRGQSDDGLDDEGLIELAAGAG